MITGDQIASHLVGDYILQSDWMANEKTKRSLAAAVHALTYALPFLFFRPSLAAISFIVVTHFIIDRWRLARHVVWAKNWIGLPHFGGGDYRDPVYINRPWRECITTGYSPHRPVWLSTWLLIIADNTLHMLCNGIALRWL